MADQENAASTDAAENTEASSTPVSSASLKLVAAREKLGFSQKEVADKLYLTTTFIRYIDDGEFERIPKPAFIKGYLRSYARVVELSGDEIVSLYEAELQATDPTPEIKGVTEEKVGTASITGPVLQTGLVGLLGLVVVMGLIWWLVADDDGDSNRPVVTQPSVTKPGPTVEERVPGPEPEAFSYIGSTGSDENAPEAMGLDNVDELDSSLIDEDAAAEPLEDNNPVDQDAAPAVDTDNTGDQQEVEATPEPEQDVTTDSDPIEEILVARTTTDDGRLISVNAGGSDSLTLTFSEECWVEVQNDVRGMVYQDLHRNGDRLEVNAESPLRVLLGKATAVEMLYNGRPFDLEPFTSQDETAKLTISE